MPPQQQTTEETESKQPDLEKGTIILMLCTAIFYDALQALLNLIFIGFIVTPFAFFTFYLWFKMKRISFMTPKRFATMGGGVIFELIPILNTLPAWTLAVVLMVLDVKGAKRIGIINR